MTTDKNTQTADNGADALAALKAQLQAQLVGKAWGPQEDYDKPTNIVVAKNGVFRVVTTPIGNFITQLAKTEAKVAIPGLPEMKEGVELKVPKIPFKYWLQVYHWYKDIDTKDKTEASILFFWNTNNVQLPTQYTDNTDIKGLTVDGQLIVYCPKQRNSGGLSEFHMDSMVGWLREHTTPLLETHSHNTMGAFFSSTDDANENATQFYAVYGKIQDKEPAFVFRFCSGEFKIQCSPDVLFDFPKVKTTVVTTKEFVGVEGVDPHVEEKVTEASYKGPWPLIGYPEDWMGQHTKAYAYQQKREYAPGPGKYSTSKTGGATPSSGKDPGYDERYGDYGYGDAFGYGYGDYGYESQAEATARFLAEKEAQSLKKTRARSELESGTEVADILEHGTTKVEIYAGAIPDRQSHAEVELLIEELCTFRFDTLLLDNVKEMSEGDDYYEDGGYMYY